MGKTRFNEPIIAPGYELFSGGSVGAGEWVFDATKYSLDVDGSNDNTTAVRDTWDAAVTYGMANETRYCEILLPVRPDPYNLAAALAQGGTTFGNSQLPIPIVAADDRKLTIYVRAALDAAAMPYWDQDVGQRWGVTLYSTLTGQTVSGAWGAPSIMGGPAVSGSSATYGSSHDANFNNVCVILDGIGFLTPAEPTVGAVNFRGLAECRILNCAAMANASPAALNAAKPPNNDWTFGFMLPDPFNNDLSVINNASVYGLNDAFVIGEHSWIDRAAAIYCGNGFNFLCVSENNHSVAAGALSCEASTNAITTTGNAEYEFPIHVAALSCETISGYHVNDPSNCLSGELHLTALSGPDTIAVNGGDNLRILAANQNRGPLTAPNVPATTVALQNPFWLDCDVLISGGTVTEVTVDGVTTGLTSGWFPVRSGGTISWTGSSAPTWKWWAR
jgi:hypothetical protein